VVERRDVGRALDRGVAPQRQDATAWSADVAEQELQDRGRPNGLDAGRVLRPTDRVAPRGRAVATRGATDCLGDAVEQRRRDAADLLNHLRRVAREVPPQHLEHAARVLQRLVALPAADRLPDALLGRLLVPFVRAPAVGVPPAAWVVFLLLGVEAGEHAVELLGVLELLAQD